MAHCDVCGNMKSATTKNWGAMRPGLPPTQPFTHYSVDFMFGFPPQGGGPMQYDGIMLAVDLFSKRPIAIPVWDAAPSRTVEDCPVQRIAPRRDCPCSGNSFQIRRIFWAIPRKLLPAVACREGRLTKRTTIYCSYFLFVSARARGAARFEEPGL